MAALVKFGDDSLRVEFGGFVSAIRLHGCWSEAFYSFDPLLFSECASRGAVVATRVFCERHVQGIRLQNARILALLRRTCDAAGCRHIFQQIMLGQHRKFGVRGLESVSSSGRLTGACHFSIGHDSLDPSSRIYQAFKLLRRDREFSFSLGRHECSGFLRSKRAAHENSHRD